MIRHRIIKNFGWSALLVLLTPLIVYAEPLSLEDISLKIDILWVLLAAVLVFFMQVGFLALEVGSVRHRAATITALKNVGDWTVCAAVFFGVGWAIMFGHSWGGVAGLDFWFLKGDSSSGHPIGISVHFMYQLAFAGTAATIISGALAERTSFYGYLLVTLMVTSIIYPVVGHWVWGNSFFADNVSFLTKLGFIDFAGSTVVHSLGGWVALVGIITVGPRLGRFNAKGEVKGLETTGIYWTGLGVLILYSTWGTGNGGSFFIRSPLHLFFCLSC